MALQQLRSSTANKRPTAAAMSDGQLAVNTNATNPGLFFKDADGSVRKIGPVFIGSSAPNSSPASGGSTGHAVGEQWLDNTGGTYVLKIWDGTAWRSESGTFVDVSGDTMTGALGVVAGSASAPGVFFSGDTNTGLLAPAADSVAITTGGTQRITVDSSGKVAIGGTTVTDSNLLNLQGSSASVNVGAVFNDTNTSQIYGIQNGSSALKFFDYTASTERMRIDSVGRVGVGVSTMAGGAGDLTIIRNSALRWADSDGTQRADIYGDSSSNLVFRNGTGSSEQMRITSAGNVGIGSTNPLVPFVLSHDGNQNIEMGYSTGTSSHYVQAYNRSTSAYQQLDIAGSVLTFKTPTESMRIDSSGNVGIGDTAPSAKFSIKKPIDSSAYGAGTRMIDFKSYFPGYDETGIKASIFSGVDSASPLSTNKGYLAFLINNGSSDTSLDERMRIDSSGNVGIGTTSIDKLLHVQGAGTSGTQVQIEGTLASAGLKFVPASGDNYEIQATTDSSLIVYNRTDAAERLRIDSSGNVGIGKSSDLFYRLTFQEGSGDASRIGWVSTSGNRKASIDCGNTAAIVFNTGTGDDERMRIDSSGVVSLTQNQARFALSTQTGMLVPLTIQNSGNNTSATLIEFKGWNGSVIGSISGFVNQTTYATSSDYRLKENVVDLTNATDRLKQLRPKRFNFIENPDLTLDGFLAHEAQQVVSNAVTGEHDKVDQDGDPVYQGMDHSKLVPLLTAALKEAIAKIETLEQRLSDAGIA